MPIGGKRALSPLLYPSDSPLHHAAVLPPTPRRISGNRHGATTR